MLTALPLDALEMAIWTRQRAGHNDDAGRLDGPVQHSDAGVPVHRDSLCRAAGRRRYHRLGSVGDSYDNAMAESVIGLYKLECVRHDGPFRTTDDLGLATIAWVHWFDEQRLHSSIGLVTPVEFENEHYRRINP